MTNNELYHHGVKGMKWGVRRYQNYDGSYTKKGLARYQKAQSDYDQAKQEAQEAKISYKSGTSSKAVYKTAKNNVRTSKKSLNKAYDKLKLDKRADEGKKLYQSGKTITGGGKSLGLKETLVVFGAEITRQALEQHGNERVARVASNAIAIGGSMVNAIMYGKQQWRNKQLRAYYGHSSK